MSRAKLITRVIEALREGADTSNEIADMLGEPVAVVSATLSDLKDSGVVRNTGRVKRLSATNRPSLCVELCAQPGASQ